MLNDLRSLPEIRNRYQFWAYAYPTGQPFWYSAAQMRDDLQDARDAVDPDRGCAALNAMVLVGHSMGGLLAKLQTLPGGDPYWRILTDRPLEELKADPEARQQIAKTIFFRPNPDVRRVITIGTPHNGSYFANDYARWLGRKLITLPTMLAQTKQKILRDNPGYFRNTELFTVNTSIDSLSPESPLLPVMLASETPPWVKYHTRGAVSAPPVLGGRTVRQDVVRGKAKPTLPTDPFRRDGGAVGDGVPPAHAARDVVAATQGDRSARTTQPRNPPP